MNNSWKRRNETTKRVMMKTKSIGDESQANGGWKTEQGRGRETDGHEGETAGLESCGMKRLEVGSWLEMFMRHIECISDEIQIACSQKSG